jgi:hypothetical protein
MNFESDAPLAALWQQIQAFLPTLAAGLLVVAVGFLVGWLAKRAVVRLLTWLRLDRLAGRAGWRAAFGKGDVRITLYNLIGNVTGMVIVLVVLADALERWGLLGLSQVVDSVVFFVPNLVLAGIILAAGVAGSNALEDRVVEILEDEGVVRARLIGLGVKAAMVALIVALILWQLHLARELVLAAFLIGFGSLGVAFALAVGLGSYRAIERGLGAFFRKKDD